VINRNRQYDVDYFIIKVVSLNICHRMVELKAQTDSINYYKTKRRWKLKLKKNYLYILSLNIHSLSAVDIISV